MPSTTLPVTSRILEMTTYRQLTIWDVLDELSESPATSSLVPMWECLDAELENLPLEAQLSTAALAFSQIADILKSRAEVLLQDTRDLNSPKGPIVRTGHGNKSMSDYACGCV